MSLEDWYKEYKEPDCKHCRHYAEAYDRCSKKECVFEPNEEGE